MKKKLMLIVPVALVLCVCGLLIASLQFGGTPIGGLNAPMFGYGSQGVPPGGGSCENVNQVYEDNPFHGWPVQFRECDWATISAYYCTPHYFSGYTHHGIDITNYWSTSESESIHGAPLIATAPVAKVSQAVYSVPAQWNYGMGNFVQLVGFEPLCEDATGVDLNGDGTVGDFCGSVCERDIDQDLNQDGSIGDYCGEESSWKATYMHMLDVSVSAGQIVHSGDLIGHVNNSGNSTGDHLHYQINGPEGPIDPATTFECAGYDWQTGVDEGR